MRYAVLGYPVKHSRSPIIFNFLKEKFNLTFSYEILELHPQEFLNSWDKIKSFSGLNVTSPYKQKVLELCKTLSPEVELLGAANVLKNTDSGWSTYNTDVFGFQESIKNIVNGTDSALVLGSSGAAKAVICALKKRGLEKIYVKARSTGDYNNEPVDVIVNATTVGMGQSTIDLAEKEFFNVNYSQTKLSYDLIYFPKLTPFMQIAQNQMKSHAMVKNGEDMLVLQALKTFEIWFDQKLSDDDRKKLLAEIKEIL